MLPQQLHLLAFIIPFILYTIIFFCLRTIFLGTFEVFQAWILFF